MVASIFVSSFARAKVLNVLVFTRHSGYDDQMSVGQKMDQWKMGQLTDYKYGILFCSLGMSLAASTTVMAQLSTAGDSDIIEKCQDGNGLWHYGTYAARACTQGRVSVLSPQGVVIEQKESLEVLMNMSDKEHDEMLAGQRKQVALQLRQSEDQAYLSRYSDADAVMVERDRKLAERDAAILTAKKVQADLSRDVVMLQARKKTDEVVAAKNEQAIQEREESIAAFELEVLRYQAEQKSIQTKYAQKVVRFKEAMSRMGKVQQP